MNNKKDNNMLKYIVAATIAFAPMATQAQNVIPDNGNEILKMCNETDYFSQGLCYGYMRGISHTLDTWAASNKASPFCRPDGVTFQQLKDVVVSYVEVYPAKRTEPAAWLVTQAEIAAWPCQ